MKIKILVVLLLQMAIASVVSQTPDKAKLDTYFQTLEANKKFMGSLAISQNGKIIYSKAVGYADVEKNMKNTENTIFRIGSISKMFTASLIFKAVELHKLNLEDKISKYFPAMPNADKITIAMLLSHRSGIHNFTDDADYLSWATTPKTAAEMVAVITKSNSDFEPDSKVQYSNSNYVLLTVILEKTFSKSYKDLISEKITKPLALKNTYYGGKINTSKNESNSYKFTGKWEKDLETDMSIPLGAGSMVSTPTDLVRFIEALFAGKIISSASLEQMKTMRDKYGMGMLEIPVENKVALGHTGGIDSFVSVLGYIPDDKLAVAITSNGKNFSESIMSVIIKWVNNKPFEIPDFKSAISSSAELDKYLGIYATKELPMKITITKNDVTLVAQATGQDSFPMDSRGKNIFEYKAAGVVLEFKPEEKHMLLKQNGRSILFTKE